MLISNATRVQARISALALPLPWPRQALHRLLSLYRRHLDNDGYLQALKETGGPVSLAHVLYPFRANENEAWLLVNGTPPLIDVDDQRYLALAAMLASARNDEIRRRYPNATFWPGDRGAAGPAVAQGGREFVVDYLLRDLCHPCAIIGYVRYAPSTSMRTENFWGRAWSPSLQAGDSATHAKSEVTPVLETTITGSLPKPSWLAEPRMLWAPWRIEGDSLAEAQRDAILLALKEQEDAGIDILTDGEQARQHFVHGFLEHIDGVDFTRRVTMGIRNNRYEAQVPTVTGPLRRRGGVHRFEAARRSEAHPPGAEGHLARTDDDRRHHRRRALRRPG